MEFRRLRKAISWALDLFEGDGRPRTKTTRTDVRHSDKEAAIVLPCAGDPEGGPACSASPAVAAPVIMIADGEGDDCVFVRAVPPAPAQDQQGICAANASGQHAPARSQTPPPSYEEFVAAQAESKSRDRCDTRLLGHIMHFRKDAGCRRHPFASISCNAESSVVSVVVNISPFLGGGTLCVTLTLEAPLLFPMTPASVLVRRDEGCSIDSDTLSELQARLAAATATSVSLRRVLVEISEFVSPASDPVLPSPNASRTPSTASHTRKSGSCTSGAEPSASDSEEPESSENEEGEGIERACSSDLGMDIPDEYMDGSTKAGLHPLEYSPQATTDKAAPSFVVAVQQIADGPGKIIFESGDAGIVVNVGHGGFLRVRNLETGLEADVAPVCFVDAKSSFLPPQKEIAALRVLTPEQAKAVENVNKSSAALSRKAMEGLRDRFERLKLSEDDLHCTLLYIRDRAPVVVHLNLTKVGKKLLADTHYRNQFETGVSGGYLNRDARIKWEDALFGDAYKKVADFDRCKYGVLNVVKDPKGVAACSGSYGDSYMRLKGVRLRCTFSPRDSGNGSIALLSTCEHYAHVLKEYTDDEIRLVVGVARSGQGVSSAKISVYKEVQIHGPLLFSQHVEALVVNQRHNSDPEMVKSVQEFCKTNGCALEWME